MLRHLAEFQDMQPTTLIFAVNREDELFAADIIGELEAMLPNLTVVLSVWLPQNGWSGFTGTAADAFAAMLDGAAELPDVYVCGPPKLVDSVLAVAGERGLAADRIFREKVQPR